LARTKEFVGKTVEVLIEKVSKKSAEELSGRNSQSLVVVFPREEYKIGDFVNVKIINCTSGTLIGEAIGYGDMQIN
jgi:tRNA-2-methylthio-N6-dimethylallyladenosine synthase